MSRVHLLIPHQVPGTVEQVFSRFDRTLFEALAPAFPPAKLLRFDGSATGDIVEIRLGIPPFSQRWRSVITAHEMGDGYAFFVDEGEQLPFPLSYWRHKHLIEVAKPGVVTITEDITFATPYNWLSRLLTPIIRQQFEARGPKYREVFTD